MSGGLESGHKEVGASVANDLVGVRYHVHAVVDPLVELPLKAGEPLPGHRFVALDIEVERIGDRPLRLNNLSYEARSSDGLVFGERDRSHSLGEATLLGEIGHRGRGIVVFEIPTEFAAENVIYEVQLSGMQGTGICAGHPRGDRCLVSALPTVTSR